MKEPSYSRKIGWSKKMDPITIGILILILIVGIVAIKMMIATAKLMLRLAVFFGLVVVAVGAYFYLAM